MKNLFLILLMTLTLGASAQKIGGFYSGTLFSDSANMLQKYELALSEYRGKITGWSYVTFVKNDTFYYGIREIKAEIVGDSLVVQDAKMIVNNFPEKPAKGVGRVITMPLKGQDSIVVLSGRWKTNQTKKYYSVPGAIDLNRSTDSAHSPLIAHLQELGLIAPPVQYQNVDNSVAVAEPKKKKSEENAEKKSAEAKQKKSEEDAMNKTAEAKQKKKEEDAINKQMETKPTEAVVKTEKPKKEKAAKEKDQVVAVSKPVEIKTVPTVMPFTERNNRIAQNIEVSSDSLVLAFYDNGVVDGDSISVYLNNQPVVNNLRLTTVASKKWISVANLDEIKLQLVAENMGTIPPNTGLVTIRDGENLYQVNFSADMQNNAVIIIHRKKK